MGARGCDGTGGEPIPERSGKRQHCEQAMAGLRATTIYKEQ